MKKTILVGFISFVLGGLAFTAISQTVEGAKDKVKASDYSIYGYRVGRSKSDELIKQYNDALKAKDPEATRMYQEILIEQNFVIIGQNLESQSQNADIIKALGKLR